MFVGVKVGLETDSVGNWSLTVYTYTYGDDNGGNGFYYLAWQGPSLYTRTSTSGWGTICLPYAATTDAATTAYEVVGVDDAAAPTTLYLTEATMEAGKPYVFKTTAGGTATFTQSGTDTVDEPVLGANNLVGYFTAPEAQDGWYILSGGTWYVINNASEFSMGTNRAYISSMKSMPVYSSGSSDVKAVSTSVFGDATAINGLTTQKASALTSGSVYTLGGQRVSHVSKGGLYIVDGKKVLVK